jgi:UDP-3-O-[3-hydroxymyristoyl] glucosamine N-acyltransferase
MLFPAVTGFGLAEFVTLRSACVVLATPIVTVAELLAVFVSLVDVATIAVSVMIVPAAVPALTVTTTGNVLIEPGATVGLVQLMDPAVVQIHPVGTGLSETKVVLAGNASVNVALAQLLGPELVTTCV